MKAPGLIIAVGKSGPPPLDTPGKRGGFGRGPEPTPEHEAAETPEYEAKEEYGAKLLGDMLAPIVDAGADEDHAKEILAQIFDAAAKCLRGGGESAVAEHDAGGQNFEGGGEEEKYGQ